MTIKQYLILMTICTVLLWGAWLLVLFFINPETTSWFGFCLFYLALLFALIGTLSIISYLLRRFLTKRYTKAEEVQVSFRQAIFLAAVFTVALFLQANHLMNWVNTMLLVAFVTLIEFFILSLEKDGQHQEGL